MKSLRSTYCTLTLTLFAATAAHAQSEAPVSSFYTPTYRGQSGSESAFWSDSFTNAYAGANQANSLAPGGINLANASVTQTTDGGGGTFIIGQGTPPAGDIYSYSAVNTFVLNYSVSNPANFLNGIGNVVFQTETAGSGIDYSSVLLNYSTSSGTQSLSATPNVLYTDTADTGFGPSSDVLTEWSWNLPLSDDVTSFSIAFNGSGTSVALERVMLDVSPTPEPNSLALIGVAGLGMFFVVRRRQASV